MELQDYREVRSHHPIFLEKALFEDMMTANMLYKIYQTDDVWMYFGHPVHVIEEVKVEEE